MSFHDLIAHFFLALNNILSHACATQFIRLPTEGQLSCVQVLTVMNKAAVPFMFRFSCGFKFSYPLDKYQRAWWLDHMIRVCLVFKKLPNCLPKCTSFAFPLAVKVTFVPCLHLVLYFGHSGSSVVVSHCYFYLHLAY
jgi:hypothetical protein